MTGRPAGDAKCKIKFAWPYPSGFECEALERSRDRFVGAVGAPESTRMSGMLPVLSLLALRTAEDAREAICSNFPPVPGSTMELAPVRNKDTDSYY